MVAGANGVRSLRETPTWAVALVSAVFVIISVLNEHGIHSLEKWFRKLQKKAMIEALEKIKADCESSKDIVLELHLFSTLMGMVAFLSEWKELGLM
ncbi:unnamed protein product [Camellia sinensis]